MSKMVICVFLFTFWLSTSFAQNSKDSITIIKRSYGHMFIKDGNELSIYKVSDLLSSDFFSAQLMHKAKTTYTEGAIVGSAGGCLILYELATVLLGNRGNAFVFGAGLLSIGGSVAISLSADKQETAAIRYYNGHQPKTSSAKIHPAYYLAFSGARAGIIMRF